jgi:hypothetical protein
MAVSTRPLAKMRQSILQAMGGHKGRDFAVSFQHRVVKIGIEIPHQKEGHAFWLMIHSFLNELDGCCVVWRDIPANKSKFPTPHHQYKTDHVGSPFVNRFNTEKIRLSIK